jgi:hypothetical protein
MRPALASPHPVLTRPARAPSPLPPPSKPDTPGAFNVTLRLPTRAADGIRRDDFVVLTRTDRGPDALLHATGHVRSIKREKNDTCTLVVHTAPGCGCGNPACNSEIVSSGRLRGGMSRAAGHAAGRPGGVWPRQAAQRRAPALASHACRRCI